MKKINNMMSNTNFCSIHNLPSQTCVMVSQENMLQFSRQVGSVAFPSILSWRLTKNSVPSIKEFQNNVLSIEILMNNLEKFVHGQCFLGARHDCTVSHLTSTCHNFALMPTQPPPASIHDFGYVPLPRINATWNQARKELNLFARDTLRTCLATGSRSEGRIRAAISAVWDFDRRP